jgi:hypothetical protein
MINYMTPTLSFAKDKVSVPRMEYLRLKKLDEHFKDFWFYIEHLVDIRQARERVKRGKVISQEKLFKKLGF